MIVPVLLGSVESARVVVESVRVVVESGRVVAMEAGA
jgi:hypothetical protein